MLIIFINHGTDKKTLWLAKMSYTDLSHQHSGLQLTTHGEQQHIIMAVHLSGKLLTMVKVRRKAAGDNLTVAVACCTDQSMELL